MDESTKKDLISNLPHDIIEIILMKLPIRDAVRTSVLSTKWRYRWSTMKQLVFDEDCVRIPHDDGDFNEEKFFNFIMRCLLLHDGDIIKFSLSSWYMDRNPAMDQFLLFLSRKRVKELVFDRGLPEPSLPTPSGVFSCQQLTSLNICGFEVKTPLKFRGFPILKYLSLEYDIITREVVENLISGCPLLEKFIFTNVEHLALRVRAPNLKHLILNGDFKHIYLEHAPLLVAISIKIDTEGSEGKSLVTVPVTYYCLKSIELKRINFKEMNEVLYVLHLILQSPNLQELQISSVPFDYAYFKAADKDFWEKECPPDFILKHLKRVKISGVCSKRDMKFIKFVLGRSPVLEMMRVSYDDKYKDYRKKIIVENELLHLERDFPKVDMKFFKSSS